MNRPFSAILLTSVQVVVVAGIATCAFESAQGSGPQGIEIRDKATPSRRPGDMIRQLGSDCGHHWWEVYGVAWSPDGNQIASVGGDRNLFVWDTETLAPIAVANDLPSTLHCVAWNPAGDEVAIGLSNGQLRIYELRNSQLYEAHRLTGHGQRLNDLVYSQDGQLIAGGTQRIHIYDVRGDHPIEVRVLPISASWNFSLSANGSILAVGGTKLTVWDISRSPPEKLAEDSSQALSVAISSDGQRIVTGGFSDSATLTLWEFRRGNLMQLSRWRPESSGGIRAVALAPDGKTFACSAGYTNLIQIWDVSQPEPKQLASLQGHRSKAFDLAFSLDGRQLVSASSDHTVRLWQIRPIAQQAEASLAANQLPTQWRHIEYLEADRLVIQSGLNAPTIVDLRAEAAPDSIPLDARPSHYLAQLQCAPARDRVALFFEPMRSATVQDVSNVPRYIELRQLGSSTVDHQFEGHFRTMVWSPDGLELATGSKRGLLQRWNALTGRLISECHGQGVIKALAYSVNGTEMVAIQESRDELADYRKELLRWRFQEDSGLSTQRWSISAPQKLDEVVIARGGDRFAVRSRGGPIFIWELRDNELVELSEIQAEGQYFMDTFSPDGRMLAMHTWGSSRNLVGVFDVTTGQPHQQWPLLGDTLGTCFSPRGGELATSNLNGTIYFLPIRPLQSATSSHRANPGRRQDTVPPTAFVTSDDPKLRAEFNRLDLEYQAAVKHLRESWKKSPPKFQPASGQSTIGKELPYLEYAKAFMKLATSHPETTSARDALIRVCDASLISGVPKQNRLLRELKAAAADELLRRHFHAPELKSVVNEICWNTKAPEETARRFIREHSDRHVRAHASLALARFFLQQLGRQASADDRKVAIDLYQRLIDQFGDLRFYDGGPTFRAVATKERQRITSQSPN